jgi:tRNA-specific 2-thiouridylase
MIKGKEAIAVAVSGGVDSSYAAAMLKDEGWNVMGIHLLLPLPPRERAKRIRIVRLVSDRLNIPLFLLDVRGFFQKEVIDYFIGSYYTGLTPNPCVVCNYLVKFEQIMKWMDTKGIDYLATGHYARVRENSNGRCRELLKARDGQKDQSYFLHRLNQSHLSRAIFPLGDMTKADVYHMAKEKGLLQSIHLESQEICFIPDNDYRSFLKTQVNRKMISPGNIVDLEGNILGVHPGTYAYTIGQRHGLGVASREPLYVHQIRPEKNEVVAGPRKALFTKVLTAGDFNWIGGQPDKKKVRVQAQIRYRHKAADGTLSIISPNLVQFEFDQPQWAITPGQALVCYEGEKVLGGGWIKKSI